LVKTPFWELLLYSSCKGLSAKGEVDVD
jgi:hypothetical protein